MTLRSLFQSRGAVVATALAMTLTGPPSASYADEVRTILANHQDWRVDLFRNEDGVYQCEATTFSDDGFFEIAVDQSGVYSTTFYLDETWGRYGRDTFLVEVGNTDWSLHDAQFYPIGSDMLIWFTWGQAPKHRDFVRDVMQSSEVRVRDSQQKVFHRFSLRGSTAAIRSMEDCYSIIAVR